jgi:hypothetical protein
VTSLADILEVVLVQCDVRVVAVEVIQPYLVVVDDQTRLLVAQLTDAAIYCNTFIYIALPGSQPWPALIELFLGQHCLALRVWCFPCTPGQSPEYTGKELNMVHHGKEPKHLCPALHGINIAAFRVSFYFMLCCPVSVQNVLISRSGTSGTSGTKKKHFSLKRPYSPI